MSVGNILEYWHELHSRQSDWAFRAYDRLVKTLSKDVQEKLQQTNGATEPYIVIFGKTQVGKTTLLLDLMGIDHARMPEISQVLRGGREAGKSATATAMEYCRSVSDRWGLTLQSETRWFDTNDAVTYDLMQLRDKMENGLLLTTSPCVVHIPESFFLKTDTVNGVRILDLPGDNPANEVEQRHVTQMAKTYLPFADLILLVGRGDDLSFLQAGVITLPGIEDWQAMPHRFRIVTTYSYSAQSIKDFLRHDECFDINQIRKRLIQQIELFGSLSDDAKDANGYFPLEFGSSWMGLEKSEPLLHARMVPIITKLRTELLEQIVNATTQVGRFRSMLNTHLSIQFIQKKKKELVEKEIAELFNKEHVITGELASWSGAIEKTQSKLSKLTNMLANNTIEHGVELIGKAVATHKFNGSVSYPPQEGANKNNCETLRGMVRDYCHLLKEVRLDVVIESDIENKAAYWTKVRKNVAEPDVKTILDDAFLSIRQKLDSYWIDKYFSSSNYNDDRNSVRHAGSNAKAAILQQWEGVWLAALKEVDEKLQLERRSAKIKLDADSEEHKNSLKKQDFIKQSKAFNRAKLELIERTAQEDLERCDRLILFLDEEYLAEFSRRMDMALQEDDDCDALLQVLSCTELMNQREEFMRLNEGGYKK